MDKRKIVGLNDLTPIDIFENIAGFNKMYFKRDDLYLPYNDDYSYLGGGKLRQTISLFENLKDELKNYNGIISYSSVGSPQAIIVMKVAKEMGYEPHLVFGVNGTIESVLKKHKPIRECERLGTHLYNAAKIGYNTVLKSRTEDIAKEKNLYVVHFGINIDDAPEALTNSISDQVQNIPDKLDVMIIPIGSGIQTAAILHGIKKYNKNVNRVIGVQISGYDRSKTINKILEKLGSSDVKYEQIIDKTYPYSKHLEYHIKDFNNHQRNFSLNVVYESKSLKYIETHRKELGLNKTDDVLYWNVADNNFLYH